jgi:hypothetical protein
MDEDGSRFEPVRKAKKRVRSQPRSKVSPLETQTLFCFRNPPTLVLVRSVRPPRPGLRTELTDQPIIPEQKHIRLKADILTIRLPRIDQSVNLIAVMDLSPYLLPDPKPAGIRFGELVLSGPPKEEDRIHVIPNCLSVVYGKRRSIIGVGSFPGARTLGATGDHSCQNDGCKPFHQSDRVHLGVQCEAQCRAGFRLCEARTTQKTDITLICKI